jgi:putative flippase GtrA
MPQLSGRQFIVKNRDYIVRYLGTGAISACVDLSAFQYLLLHGVYRLLTTTLSFLLAVCVHFTLNKVWTFKSYQRPVAHQIGTYVGVLAVALIVTQITIETLVRAFGVAPLVAKVISIGLQVPISFLGHRYLTFRFGALAAVRELLALRL